MEPVQDCGLAPLSGLTMTRLHLQPVRSGGLMTMVERLGWRLCGCANLHSKEDQG
jgi:hypothetical protein